MRDMQERVPEGPEPTAAPARAQPAVEASAEGEGGGGAEEGVRMSGEELRPPREFSCAGGLDGDKETLQQKARREEAEMRKVFQEIRCSL